MNQNYPRRVSFITNLKLDEATGCWNWTGTKTRDGYGRMRYLNKTAEVHRVSAHCYLGFDLNSPLFVCHKCDNPSCFNPKHLFIGTRRDNAIDAVRKGLNYNIKKTHCKLGHPFSGSNLYVTANGARSCRACHVVWSKIDRMKKKLS